MFSRIASAVAQATGRPVTFIVSILLVILWAVMGPPLHFSDAWQLAINTPTTIITTLLVILERNTSGREMKALHLKIDELIASNEKARNTVRHAENLAEAEIDRLRSEGDDQCR